MNDLPTPYPPNPLHVPAAVTEPSASFKKEVKKVMTAITLFFIVYILLIIFSIVLAVSCITLGISIIALLGSLIGLAAGLGIISIGVLVFVFLVKFIFSVKKFDTSGSIEITEADQPVLFAFIQQLTKDTQTQFPRKIVISPDVNACVFYNDSFWSMIFPVKKNLQIGLGLVNSLTISEFKAVMAHEFGHFSQRSMKLGSFVYNVNKVIYNMLYENKNYGAFLNSFGSLHWAIYIFVSITIELVKLIQKILQKMYGFINKSYMGLSREMEFHADAVAATVSGGNHLVAALQKLEISDACYNTVIQKANDWLKEKTAFENIYTKHHVVMAQYAKDNNLPVLNNVPQVNNEFYASFQQSRINIKDQWASHPSREDRERHLQQLNIEAVSDNRPAWLLFDKPAELQKEVTRTLYKDIAGDLKNETVTGDHFKERYLAEISVYHLPAQYNGYFDDNQPANLDVDNALNEVPGLTINEAEFDNLFSAEKKALLKSLKVSQSDAQILHAIADKQAAIKTFDYNGQKYKKAAAAGILLQLEQEIREQEMAITNHENKITTFFFSAARQNNNGDDLAFRNHYLQYSSTRKKMDEYTAICHRIVNLFAPLVTGQQMTLQDADTLASNLRKESNSLRPLLIEWIDKKVFINNSTFNEKAMKFCGATYRYFSGDGFFDMELKELDDIVKESMRELIPWQYAGFKSLLEYQLQVYQRRMAS